MSYDWLRSNVMTAQPDTVTSQKTKSTLTPEITPPTLQLHEQNSSAAVFLLSVLLLHHLHVPTQLKRV